MAAVAVSQAWLWLLAPDKRLTYGQPVGQFGQSTDIWHVVGCLATGAVLEANLSTACLISRYVASPPRPPLQPLGQLEAICILIEFIGHWPLDTTKWQLPVRVASLNQLFCLGHVLCAIWTEAALSQKLQDWWSCKLSVVSWVSSSLPNSLSVAEGEPLCLLFPISITSRLTINTIFYFAFIATITIYDIFFPHSQLHSPLALSAFPFASAGLVSVNSFKFMSKADCLTVCGKSE